MARKTGVSVRARECPMLGGSNQTRTPCLVYSLSALDVTPKPGPWRPLQQEKD